MTQYNEQQREYGPRYATVADVRGVRWWRGGGGVASCDGEWIDVRVHWGGGHAQ